MLAEKQMTNDQLAECIRSEIQALRGEMSNHFEEMALRVMQETKQAIDEQTEIMNDRFAALALRINQMDR